jgi:two-component system NarL family response regulator
MDRISIAVVDDHRVVSRSLKAYLESFPDLIVVGVASSGEELLEHLQTWKPQIVLQDLLLPGGMTGLRAGACGYVRKDADPETLLAAVRAVAKGKTYIDPAVGRQLVAAAGSDDLTPRETEVLRHLAHGLSNREIAAALDIGDATVKTYVANLLAKLGVENRAQATVQAIKRGLVALDE